MSSSATLPAIDPFRDLSFRACDGETVSVDMILEDADFDEAQDALINAGFSSDEALYVELARRAYALGFESAIH
jgi:hypothetical protein